MTRDQFKRALSQIGTGSIKGTLNYNDHQLNLISDHFSCQCHNNVTHNNNNKQQSDREVFVYNNEGDLVVVENGENVKNNSKTKCYEALKDDILWTEFACELERGVKHFYYSFLFLLD